MSQSTNKIFDIVILVILFLLSSYLCYSVSLTSLELLNINYVFLTKMSSFFSAFIPLSIFLFYLFTTKYMFAVYDIDFNFFTVFKIVSFSYLPILFTQAITFYIIIGLNSSNFNTEFTYLNTEFLGFNLSNIFKAFEYFWGIFYLIFIILIKKEYKFSLKKTLFITLLPTGILLIFNYL